MSLSPGATKSGFTFAGFMGCLQPGHITTGYFMPAQPGFPQAISLTILSFADCTHILKGLARTVYNGSRQRCHLVIG
jgi:hypothetical protein